ncbi:hypothetical protein [Soonwooa sp.]|uniref:hypothetical protein n=1 Tax=Soonwooa sp. TaxID=1938592 RepID=UPI00261A7C36|nr:hypothetical protein [Soonwooa sp.]
MKTISVFILLAVISCNKRMQQPIVDHSKNGKSETRASQEKSVDSVYKNWIAYYVNHDKHFRPDAIKNLGESDFDADREGGTVPVYEADFDKIYTPFLIYNPSRTRYLDFENWVLDDDGNAGFDVDQELNLVDLKTKKVKKIAFYGSYYWVEDAYWKNDDVFVTLENNYDHVLNKSEYNLKTHKMTNYQFVDTLNFVSEYTQERLKRHGIKTE